MQYEFRTTMGAKRKSAAAIASMDWISINTGCFAVSNAVAKTDAALNRFVREVRESRADLDAISSELHSLDGVLDLLKDDAAAFPARLAKTTPAVLDSCLTIVSELEGCISVLGRPGVSRADKKSRWLCSRIHIGKLRYTLQGYKSALALAVDLIALTNLSHEPTSGEQSPSRERPHSDGDEKSELAAVAAQINAVTSRLRDESRQNGAVANIQQFLDALHAHAVAAVDDELEQMQGHRRDAASSVGDAPDSAIEMSGDETPFSAMAAKHTRSQSSPCQGVVPVDEIDELLDELREMPRRPPTPPPRSRARTSVIVSADQRPVTSDSSLRYDGPSRGPNHARSWSFSPAGSNSPASDSFFTAITELGPSLDGQSVTSDNSRPNSRMGRAISQVRRSIWESPREEPPTPARPSTSESSIPSTPNGRQSMVRRSSSRLSSSFRNFSLRGRSSSKSELQLSVPPIVDAQPEAIFGVSLSKSMLVAKGLAGAHHENGKTSTREYPLCVLRCVYFIRDHGITAPHVFGQDADAVRLDQLKEVFASPDTSFGKDLDWNRFSIYEAADLILLFLSELPQPLVSEAVGKRWITMSRQATISGSLAMRLDQGIDFWEESLQGLHGPARSLFKLLLGLWGDIADAADNNEMTAERLAGRVLRPLMHVPAARYDTDFMLGLAFMIRKRSEYTSSLRGITQKSNAAF
ncbi:putative RhoGAP group protein [Podospora didyma]|uniref:RhoGAP group protein n=1 Tax=Podospora didyma TaxID=330526 RepID=A0AAE0U6C9_9PEZI|nr:putative RhoGAP group protein [Podospora didyma]